MGSTMTNVPFPFNSLSPKQTVIVSELLRDHPEGRIESEAGRPVFVTSEGASAIRIPLSENRNGHATGEPQNRS